MKRQYWAARFNASPGQTRVTSTAVESARDACIECFGMSSHNMTAKPLGSTKTGVRSGARKLINDPTGWYRPELMNNIERIGCPANYVAGKID